MSSPGHFGLLPHLPLPSVSSTSSDFIVTILFGFWVTSPYRQASRHGISLDRRKLVGSIPVFLFSTSCERRLLIDISFHSFSYRNPTSIHQEQLFNPSESSLLTTSFISTSKLLRPFNANNCIVFGKVLIPLAGALYADCAVVVLTEIR